MQFLKLVFSVAVVALALYVGSAYYWLSPFYKSVPRAVAVIYPTQGNKVSGVVTFDQEKNGLSGVHIVATLKGLTPGEHGFHIHEFGACNCPDAVCAGDHYNPAHKPHSGPQTTERHVGDLGNLQADAEGNATYDFFDRLMTLNGPHSVIGRSVIIHAQKDDFTSQPSGNAGARVGCGVIGIAKP